MKRENKLIIPRKKDSRTKQDIKMPMKLPLWSSKGFRTTSKIERKPKIGQNINNNFSRTGMPISQGGKYHQKTSSLTLQIDKNSKTATTLSKMGNKLSPKNESSIDQKYDEPSLMSNYKNIQFFKIQDSVGSSFLTSSKNKKPKSNFEIREIKNYMKHISEEVYSNIIEDEKILKNLRNKKLVNFQLIVKSKNSEEIYLEKLYPVKIVVQKFIKVNNGMDHVDFKRADKLVADLNRKLSKFLKVVCKRVLEVDLSKFPMEYEKFKKLKKYSRPYFENSNFYQCSRSDYLVLEEIFIKYQLNKKSLGPISMTKTVIEKEQENSSLGPSEQNEQEYQTLQELEAERKRIGRTDKEDKRSRWAKFIDICLERDDLFAMPKRQFNRLFEIEPPERIRENVMEGQNLSGDQAETLRQLNEFSAYLKRDINIEGRALRRELDLHETQMAESEESDIEADL